MEKAEIRRKYQSAMWLETVKKRTVPTFLPLFFDRHKHLVCMGTAGSGKSIFAGQKIVERCATEDGHRVLVLRAVEKTLRESCFAQVKAQAEEMYSEQIDYIPNGKSAPMYIRFKNGSEIFFVGADGDKLKSIFNITDAWIEEANEVTEANFNQVDIRLRGEAKHYKQIILTLNPVSISCWVKKRFFDRCDERVKTNVSYYYDNPFLPEEDRKTLEAFKETDPYYYQVYCLAQWGVLGSTIFQRQKIGDQLLKRKKPKARGNFRYAYNGLTITEYQWENGENGEILIYDPPAEGHPYVIGADTAGEGSDWFVAQVIDNSSGKLAAKYRCTGDEDLFARELFCLGLYYNTALIGVEVNYSTHPTKELQRMNYPKLYMREVEDQIGGGLKMSLGFRTDRLTRPIIIAGLVGIMREHPEMIDDEDTLNEMLSFGRNEKGRPEAMPGAHDDCVMALAITYYIRDQQDSRIKKQRGQKAQWEKDQYDDYWAANEAERAAMIEQWGDPF